MSDEVQHSYKRINGFTVSDGSVLSNEDEKLQMQN
jgi:hypothetical protein